MPRFLSPRNRAWSANTSQQSVTRLVLRLALVPRSARLFLVWGLGWSGESVSYRSPVSGNPGDKAARQHHHRLIRIAKSPRRMKERLLLLKYRHRAFLPVIGASLVWYSRELSVQPACEQSSWTSWWQQHRLPHTLRKNDPIWSLSARQQRRRELDERKQQTILAEIQKITSGRRPSSQQEMEKMHKQLAALQQQWLDTVYGRNISLQERRDFLERYGCTGYTDEALEELLAIGKEHGGIVEMGAGNGQWARALSDQYKRDADDGQKRKHGFHMVLAYDNNSQLPLDPTVYHAKTQPAHEFFYAAVQPLLSDNLSIEHTLQQWSCRGRALLLVYPSPGDMAVRSVRAYSALPQKVHTVVYVGEGRGGATADEAFFAFLEDSEWVICKVLPVKSFGTKGYEKMYIIRKQTPTQ